jgi:flagellum-specific peptidoglycan hydrolase FlgJ
MMKIGGGSMATKTQVKNFIKLIAPIAINLCKTRKKWILPSVVIAQAACESNWGTSKPMAAANGLFGFKVGKGVKYGTAWKGKSYSTKTKEYYDKYVTITDNFRAYDSVEEAVEDYEDLLCSLTRYKGSVNNKDAKATITAIKNGGYATSPTYISTIMSIINSNNLTQYDSVVTGTPVVKSEEYKMKTIKKGSKGNAVKVWQIIVGVNPDGIFGYGTESATKKWQQSHGLTVDGIVGSKSWKCGLESL